MFKKAQVGFYVSAFVALTLGALLLINVAFPQWRTTTTAQQYTETTTHTKGANTSLTLDYTDLELNSLVVSGLTNGTNYTIDYDTGVLVIDDNTTNGTYTLGYNYYASGYLTDTSQRALASVVVLFLIVGLAAGGLKLFGLL